MTYELNPQLFVENGPTILASKSAAARRSSRNYLAWRTLDAERRLALLERALAPAANDDSPDGFSLAL